MLSIRINVLGAEPVRKIVSMKLFIKSIIRLIKEITFVNETDRYRIFIRDMFTCQQCGKRVGTRGQIAHRIRQGVNTTEWIKMKLFLEGYEKSEKWIKDHIIDHPHNTVTTCCLACNGKMDITFNRIESEALLNRILDNVLPDRFMKGSQTAQDQRSGVLQGEVIPLDGENEHGL
jgi:hypothetical protein